MKEREEEHRREGGYGAKGQRRKDMRDERGTIMNRGKERKIDT